MDRIKGALAVFIIRFIALLPWRLVQLLGSFIGWLTWLIPNKSKQVAHINLTHCFPELTKKEIDQLCRQTLINTGKTFTESACTWMWPAEKVLNLAQVVEGSEVLEQAMQSGKAIIGITSHLGNWELINHYYGHHSKALNFYRPPKVEAVAKLLAKQRVKTGNRIAPSTREGILNVIREVRKGGRVGIPADPEPSLKSGMFVPFLGTQVLLSKFIAGMVAGKQDQVTAVFLHAIRLEDGSGFKVILEAAPDDMYSSDTETSVAAMGRILESYVRRWPEQYMWTMKRFRRRPGLEKRWY